MQAGHILNLLSTFDEVLVIFRGNICCIRLSYSKYDETDKFDKLVDKYRNNMAGVTAQAKSKWYQ